MREVQSKVDNVEDVFQFTPRNIKEIEKIIAQYPKGRERSAVLPVLYIAQDQNGGFLSTSAMVCVSELFNMPLISVYEIVSFYTMFYLSFVGKKIIKVCTLASCSLRGGGEILSLCEEKLGVSSGQTAKKESCTLLEVGCLGACIGAPVVQVNDEFHENVTTEKMIKILKNLSDEKT